MTVPVCDYVLHPLREWDVEQVFAHPGDGINGIVSAFGESDDRPRFIQSRHEEMSAFEAVGYARFSGQVGVCMATSGPRAMQAPTGGMLAGTLVIAAQRRVGAGRERC